MKTSGIFLLFLLSFSGSLAFAQQTYTVTASGNQFAPALISAKIGDNITFSVGSFHPVLQVDESTYNQNGSTALLGGFSFPNGSGTFTAFEPGTVYYICTNHIFSGMKGKIDISQNTGVNNQNSFSRFDVYPNPADDYLYIINLSISNLKSISVFDLAGNKLIKSEITDYEDNRLPVNVGSLKKGMYFISVAYTDKIFTQKFLKE